MIHYYRQCGRLAKIRVFVACTPGASSCFRLYQRPTHEYLREYEIRLLQDLRQL